MAERRTGLGKGLEALIPVSERKNLAMVPVAAILPNPQQPRTAFDTESMDALVDSIKRIGILQPIVVRPDGTDYVLIAGERRWRASQAAGLEDIPALLRDTDDRGSLTAALVENLQREDLGPLEEAAAFQQLQEDFGMTHADIGEQVGRSRTAVSNTLRLLLLSPAIQASLASGDLSAGHARALLGVEDSAYAEHLADRAVNEGLSVRQVEEAVRARTESEGDTGEPRASITELRPAAIIELEQRLSEQLDTKVKIRYKSNKGKVEIRFGSLDQLETIYRRFFTD